MRDDGPSTLPVSRNLPSANGCLFLNRPHSSDHADMPHASAAEAAVFQRVGPIMVEQLEAEIMIAHGKTNSDLELLARTAAEEHKVSFELGPPIIVKPAQELYGEELLTSARCGRR